MRVLFTTYAMAGHFHPLAPLAREAQAARHEVLVACPDSFCRTVEASGFQAAPAGRGFRGDPELGQIRAEIDRMAPGPAQARHFFARVFCGLGAEDMIPDLHALCVQWAPDVIIWENCAFAGPIVAESLDIPHTGLQTGMLFDLRSFGAEVSEQLDRNRQSAGLPPDPDLAMLSRYLVLSWTPPRFQDPVVPLPPTLHALRAVPFDRSGHETLPDWVMALPERPTVYATLGTEMNHLPGIFPGMLQTFIAGLRDEPVNLIVTVGRDMDPSALGPQPSHVHVERYIPQSLLFPRCDLVITHGGHNTVLAAISAGLPMVMTPITADQPENAQRCAALELGRAIALPELTPDTVREAVCAVLEDAQYRTNVQRLRAEMEALPGVEHGLGLLEHLAATKTPQIVRHAMERNHSHKEGNVATISHNGITHVPVGAGQVVTVGPATTIFKLVSADTANAMALWEGTVPPGFGTPPLHAHPQSETFCLLEGELQFTGINQDGPSTFRARSGSIVFIPGGAPHRFANVSAAPARVLTITTPGGLERYFTDLAAALPTDMPPQVAMADPGVRAKMAALDVKYGVGYVHPDDRYTLSDTFARLMSPAAIQPLANILDMEAVKTRSIERVGASTLPYTSLTPEEHRAVAKGVMGVPASPVWRGILAAMSANALPELKAVAESGGHLLELGCGAASMLVTLLTLYPRTTAVGVDLSAVALAEARRRGEELGVTGRLELRRQDARDLRDTACYDVVSWSEHFFPLETRAAALAAAHRALKPSGYLVATGGDPPPSTETLRQPEGRAEALNRLIFASWGVPVLDRQGAKAELEAAGFTVLRALTPIGGMRGALLAQHTPAQRTSE